VKDRNSGKYYENEELVETAIRYFGRYISVEDVELLVDLVIELQHRQGNNTVHRLMRAIRWELKEVGFKVPYVSQYYIGGE